MTLLDDPPSPDQTFVRSVGIAGVCQTKPQKQPPGIHPGKPGDRPPGGKFQSRGNIPGYKGRSTVNNMLILRVMLFHARLCSMAAVPSWISSAGVGRICSPWAQSNSRTRDVNEIVNCDMLQHLHIQNYAIIDEITIDFSGKLNIITGETGAGKSILTGALTLILGARADSSVLLDRDKKCFVEAIFSTEAGSGVRQFLKDHDLDSDDELVIRREIGSNGKSRAFVNDTPINLEQLQRLGALLVDLHQQFDALQLAESDFQRNVLDALAAHSSLVSQYQDLYRRQILARKELKTLQEMQASADKQSDYHQFLYEELEQAGFQDKELEQLDQELQLLGNAEAIKHALTKFYLDLEDSEQSVLQQLKALAQQLQPFTSYHPALPEILARTQSAQIELRDLAAEVAHLNDRMQYDPKRIEEVSERIATGHKLLKKHGLQFTHELIALKKELENKLLEVSNIAESLVAKEQQTEALHAQAKGLAEAISQNRKAVTESLEQKVNALLIQVGMPNARLKVRLEQIALDPYGMDSVEFLFDANRHNRFEPLGKVASGGELSRLMLCIKSLVAESINLPTLIFDEIDTGISGEAAKQVGIILKDLSRARQVISITHQPQIASKADAHFYVYKEIRDGLIKTKIRLLSSDERVTTIAQMLGGEKPTAAALENAREMVMN
jgi:DNA repair protein RecN (Recombination protein N)